jgi:type VI secretion system protein ImpG
MDDLLQFYQHELASFRAYSREFATRYPKTAGSLLFGGETSDDPHIERLVQSFALLTARVKMQLEDEYPKFTEALLESLYPHYLRPLPSYSIAQVAPHPGSERSSESTSIPRGTMLQSQPVDGILCRFKTVYDVTVGAVQISSAAFVPTLTSSGTASLPPGASSAITIEIAACDPSKDMREPPLGLLRVFIEGDSSLRAALIDAIFMRGCGVSVQPKGSGSWIWLDKPPLKLAGLDDEDAIVPFSPRSNAAFRLLTEYFSYNEKFSFIDIDLAAVAKHLPAHSNAFTLRIVLAGLPGNSAKVQAFGALSAKNFQLGCTPVINLFDKRGVPTQLTHTTADHALLADSAHPAAYEIYSVNSVDLVRETQGDTSVTVFHPMYGDAELDEPHTGPVHYWLMRHDEVLADLSPGHEKRIALIDQSFSPSDQPGGTLRTELTCTNRDLPSALGYGHMGGDLTSDLIPASLSVRMLRKPSRSMRFDRNEHGHWQLISHLTANYSSLTNAGLANLRRTLRLYDIGGTAAAKRQIDGIVGLQHGAVRAWMPTLPVSSLMPGIGIRMTIDEEAFIGSSLCIFIHVIDRYFSLNSQLNCFTQLEVISKQTGEELFKCKPRVVEPLRA